MSSWHQTERPLWVHGQALCVLCTQGLHASGSFFAIDSFRGMTQILNVSQSVSASSPSFVCTSLVRTSGASDSPRSRSRHDGIGAIQASNLVSSLLRQWDLTGQVGPRKGFFSSSSVSPTSVGVELQVPFFEDQFFKKTLRRSPTPCLSPSIATAPAMLQNSSSEYHGPECSSQESETQSLHSRTGGGSPKCHFQSLRPLR